MTQRRARIAATAFLVIAAGGSTSGTASAEVALAAGVAPSVRAPVSGQWWYDAMALEELHEAGHTGKGVTVAVVDGYVDTSVPDLQGADVNVKLGCEDQETERVSDARADHGTAMVTALVGQGTGNGPGGRGIVGMVPDATVNFYSLEAEPDAPGQVSDADCATYSFTQMWKRILRDEPDVISMSFNAQMATIGPQIAAAHERGIIVVASAGDNRDNSYVAPPANVAGVVSVLAVGSDAKPWKHNVGSSDTFDFYATLSAPGVELPVGGMETVQGGWDSGRVRTGTSAATAITAGAFAMLQQQWPEASANQLLQSALHHTGGADGKLTWRPDSGWGIVAPITAVDVDPAGYPDENPLLMTPQEAVDAFPASVYQAPGAAPSESSDSSTGADPDDGAQAGTGEAGEARAGADEQGQGGGVAVPVAIGAGLGLAVLAGAVVLARRRRRQDAETESATHTSSTSGHEGGR